MNELSDEAFKKATKAKEDAGTAITQSGQAVTKTGLAEAASGRAVDKSSKAEGTASNAMTLARGARKEADSFEKDIKDAKQDASEAKALLSEVRRLAKEAQEHAVSAEKGTERLTTRFADRTLTDAQIKEISDAVRPFAGQEFDVTPYWDLPESLAIANRIADALVAGGWKYVAPEKSAFMLGGISGVQVWTHPSADSKVKRAAESLLVVLNREGIASVARTQNPANPPDPKLHLNVGSKP